MNFINLVNYIYFWTHRIQLLVLIIVFLGFSNNALSQSRVEENSKHKLGISVGYGNQSIISGSYKYDVLLFQPKYFRQLSGNQNLSLDIVLSPHFVVSKFQRNSNDSSINSSYEFGLNGGFVLKKSILSQNQVSYVQLSAGPHYIDNSPDRQISGFIFSDNLVLGFLIKIEQKLYFDLNMGFRHISNAKIRFPNKGINNIIYSVGIVIPLK